MATLPNSANPCLASFTANASGMVNITNNGGVPGVATWLDRNGNVVAKQLTAANQPSLTTLDGAGPTKFSAISFAGTPDCLTCDALAANLVVENAKLDFTVFIVAETASFASANMDLFTLGKTATDGYIRVGISSSAVLFSSKDDAAVVVSATSGTVDAKTHTIALVKNATAGTYTLYLDGTSVASGSVTGAFTPTQCTFGALRNNSTTTNYYTGGIAEIAVYKGVADVAAVSDYFAKKYTAPLG